MKQLAANACGTVAVMHTMIHLFQEEQNLFAKNSLVENFIQETQQMDPHQRGEFFLNYKPLRELHSDSVQQGQSEVQEEVETHFICFIEKEGHIYELDGRKERPINHGQTTQDNFLADTCKVIKQFMDRDPDEVKFTLMAFAPHQEQ